MVALVKTDDNVLDFFLFCPDKTCKYVTQLKQDLEIQRKLKHMAKTGGGDDEEVDSKGEGADPIVEKNTVPYMPAYKCLYCELCISTSLVNVKTHVQSAHTSEVLIVRDCVAYKRKRPSRIYLCNSTSCIFNDLDYKAYLTHLIAHRGGILYGCANCNWVAQDQKGFNEHVERQKGPKHSLLETRVIMKEDGSITEEIVASVPTE